MATFEHQIYGDSGGTLRKVVNKTSLPKPIHIQKLSIFTQLLAACLNTARFQNYHLNKIMLRLRLCYKNHSKHYRYKKN